jgi:uncharacterized protein (DUF2384 family)
MPAGRAAHAEPVIPPGPRTVDLTRVDSAACRRLSAPALRTFLNIADRWELNETERLNVLGRPPRSTYYGWVDKARRGADVALSLDHLLRLSALFGIVKGLAIVFARQDEATRWLRSPNRGPLFGGQRPLDLITDGSQEGILLVRRYLDAWRGGMFAPPDASDVDEEPLADDDIVVIDARRLGT